MSVVADEDLVGRIRSGAQSLRPEALHYGLYLRGVNLFSSVGSMNKSSRIQLASVC